MICIQRENKSINCFYEDETKKAEKYAKIWKAKIVNCKEDIACSNCPKWLNQFRG